MLQNTGASDYDAPSTIDTHSASIGALWLGTVEPLEPTERFSESEPNVIESTAGFSIRVLGRTGLRYSEGDRSAWIDSEVLATPRSIAIAMRSMKVWEAPSRSELVTEEERNRVASNIERAFLGCGYVPSFGPDAETRQAIDWLFRNRPKD